MSDIDGRTVGLGVGALALAAVGLGGLKVWRGLERYAIAAITRPRRATNTSSPADLGLAWEEVRFPSSDGIPLVGWLMYGAPDPHDAPGTIILGHGYSANRQADLSYPAFLVPAGFNVLALDFRAHGDSGGEQTSVGYLEHRDALGAVAYLQGRGLDRIGIMGYSMGAVVALVTAAVCPDIMGVVADSGYARLSTPLAQVLQQWHYPRPIARLGGALGLGFVARDLGFSRLEGDPVRLVARISPRPLFLIHGADDPLIPVSEAHDLYAAAREPKELWVAPGAVHDGGAYAVYPDEYRRRVLAFWAGVFGRAAADVGVRGWELGWRET